MARRPWAGRHLGNTYAFSPYSTSWPSRRAMSGLYHRCKASPPQRPGGNPHALQGHRRRGVEQAVCRVQATQGRPRWPLLARPGRARHAGTEDRPHRHELLEVVRARALECGDRRPRGACRSSARRPRSTGSCQSTSRPSTGCGPRRGGGRWTSGNSRPTPSITTRRRHSGFGASATGSIAWWAARRRPRCWASRSFAARRRRR